MGRRSIPITDFRSPQAPPGTNSVTPIAYDRHPVHRKARRGAYKQNQEAGGEPPHVFDGPRTEATLPQEVELKVSEKLLAFGLGSSARRACRHANFDQVLNERPRKVGNRNLGFG
ncbi:hypothetical protein ACVMH6_002068 [Rhizobium leguminosarum]